MKRALQMSAAGTNAHQHSRNNLSFARIEQAFPSATIRQRSDARCMAQTAGARWPPMRPGACRVQERAACMGGPTVRLLRTLGQVVVLRGLPLVAVMKPAHFR